MTTTQIAIVAGIGLVAVYFLFLAPKKAAPPPAIQMARSNQQSITGQIESAALGLATSAAGQAINGYFDNSDKNSW